MVENLSVKSTWLRVESDQITAGVQEQNYQISFTNDYKISFMKTLPWKSCHANSLCRIEANPKRDSVFPPHHLPLFFPLLKKKMGWKKRKEKWFCFLWICPLGTTCERLVVVSTCCTALSASSPNSTDRPLRDCRREPHVLWDEARGGMGEESVPRVLQHTNDMLESKTNWTRGGKSFWKWRG